MPRQSLSYTNRQNSTAYSAVPAKRGGLRYYITKNPKEQDLIEEMPEGLEFYEYIHDGRMVFRERETSQILSAERQIVEDAVNLSAVTDFIVEAQEKEIVVYISQFTTALLHGSRNADFNLNLLWLNTCLELHKFKIMVYWLLIESFLDLFPFGL